MRSGGEQLGLVGRGEDVHLGGGRCDGVVMVDRVPEIEEIDSRETLVAYLKTRPVEEAQVFAFRVAVRVAPLLEELLGSQASFQQKAKSTICVFRCIFVSWTAGNFPAYESHDGAYAAGLHAALYSDTNTNVSVVTSAAAWSAYAVCSRADFAATEATNIASYMDVAAGVDFWALIRSDLLHLQHGGASSTLQSSLWEDQELLVSFGLHEERFRRGLHDLGAHWQPVWDFYSAIRAGKQPFAHLGERLEKVVVGIATENEDFWSRDSDTVMQEISERLRVDIAKPLATTPPTPSEPEPGPGPGPQYDIIDGKLGIVSSPPLSKEVNAQSRLFERLKRDVERLVSAAHKIDNSHPNLAFSIREYAELLDTSLEALDVTGVWAVGGSLAGFAQSFREQNRNRTLTEPLEPEVDGLLQSVIRQHGAFIMGFEEGRDLVDRADRFALDSDKLRGLEESGNPLIAELASNADLVNDDARAVHRSVNDYVQEFGWATGRVGYASYLVVRNAVRAIIRGLAFWGFKDAVEGVRDVSGFPSSTTAISFLCYFASPLLAFFANFPEMQAYVQWALHIARQVYESD